MRAWIQASAAMSGATVTKPPTPVAAPSKRASVAWRFLAIFASSPGETAKRERLSAAQRSACGPNVRAAASAMCSGERTGSNRSRSHSPGGSSRADAVSSSVAVTPLNLATHSLPPMERKWWTLLAVCIGTFMLLLDITIVNTALPYIERALGASFTDLQWVIDAYALSLAALLLTGGSLAALFGRRPVFVARLRGFPLPSLA